MTTLANMLAAAQRLLTYYNGDEKTAQNPGGLTGVGGMADNWDPCIQDIGRVANGVGDALSAVNDGAAAVHADRIAADASAAAALEHRQAAAQAALSAAGIVQHVDVTERAGIAPILDLIFTGPAAVPSGVIQGSSGKWVISPAGALTNAPAGTAPIDYDPVTSAVRGMLVEASRTNLLVGSAAPATQSLTVTAQTYTLSYYGTGSVALSGAYAATVNSAGSYPTRTTLTFTAVSGTLTVTPSGTVQYAQLEAGSAATSYIPTTTGAIIRAADANSLALSRVPGWNPAEGTVYVEFMPAANSPSGQNRTILSIDDGTVTGASMQIMRWEANQGVLARVLSGGGNAVLTGSAAVANLTRHKAVFSWKAGTAGFVLNGASVSEAAPSGAIPTTFTTLRLGHSVGTDFLNGWLGRVTIFPRYFPAATRNLMTAA